MTREEILDTINEILLDDNKEVVIENNQLKDVIEDSFDYIVFSLGLQEKFEWLKGKDLINAASALGDVRVHELVSIIINKEV